MHGGFALMPYTLWIHKKKRIHQLDFLFSLFNIKNPEPVFQQEAHSLNNFARLLKKWVLSRDTNTAQRFINTQPCSRWRLITKGPLQSPWISASDLKHVPRRKNLPFHGQVCRQSEGLQQALRGCGSKAAMTGSCYQLANQLQMRLLKTLSKRP